MQMSIDEAIEAGGRPTTNTTTRTKKKLPLVHVEVEISKFEHERR
jgi:hypothetical protein